MLLLYLVSFNKSLEIIPASWNLTTGFTSDSVCINTWDKWILRLYQMDTKGTLRVCMEWIAVQRKSSCTSSPDLAPLLAPTHPFFSPILPALRCQTMEWMPRVGPRHVANVSHWSNSVLVDGTHPRSGTPTSRTTGTDIGELQQKISKAERELAQLRLELDQTRQQAKAAELHAQESGRTNRKLKTEIQTLTDMSNRKDRQAENAKATAFFFEGQVKKYTEEIETAQRGMGHLKELDDQLREATEQQATLEAEAASEYTQIRQDIERIQGKYKAEKEELQQMIAKTYQELSHISAKALKAQEEAETRIKEVLEPMDRQVKDLENAHKDMEKQQVETLKDIEKQVVQLRQKLEKSSSATLSHEETIKIARSEMDRIMRRLRVIDSSEPF